MGRSAGTDQLRVPGSAPDIVLRDGGTKPAATLAIGDVVVVEPGQVIPSDGTVTEGVALVDESAITGESAPVLRESGGERSAVLGGTRVISSRLLIRVSGPPRHL